MAATDVQRELTHRQLAKCPTGITGLDEITGGGLPRGRPTRVCGGPGCGKTLLSMEFVVRGAVTYGEPGVFMSFEETSAELAKNVASLKTSASVVNRGARVTFTAKLTRPGGDAIRGLPVALQRKPVSGGKWTTVGSKKTSANGTAKWTLRVKKAGLYRTLGKRVSQVDGQGVVFDKVASRSTRVRLR